MPFSAQALREAAVKADQSREIKPCFQSLLVSPR